MYNTYQVYSNQEVVQHCTLQTPLPALSNFTRIYFLVISRPGGSAPEREFGSLQPSWQDSAGTQGLGVPDHTLGQAGLYR